MLLGLDSLRWSASIWPTWWQLQVDIPLNLMTGLERGQHQPIDYSLQHIWYFLVNSCRLA